MKYKPHEDYGYYHLPYIINLVSEKIIFGLSNLQPQFGWNSTWLNFSTLLYLPLLEIKGTQLSNSILLFFVFYMFLKELFSFNNKIKLSFLFITLLSSYVIIKFSRILGHGFDFPANIYSLLALYYFIKIFEEKLVTYFSRPAMYCEGLCDFSFLNTLLKDDLELKPESSARASRLKCLLLCALWINSSTL